MKMPKQKPGKSKQDYGTPDDFLDAVCDYLDIVRFGCDLACRRDNKVPHAKTGIFWPERNSLKTPWPTGAWNWLNPEFAHIAPWAEKCATEWLAREVQTAFLVPAAVGSNWWAEFVHGIGHVLIFRPRLVFKGTSINPKTGRPDPYPKDCALVLYGEHDGRLHGAYDLWKWK